LPLDAKVHVYTRNPIPGTEKYLSPDLKISIIRNGRSHEKISFLRYWNYLTYYLKVSFKLIFWRPASVLYYETLSALPALLYKIVFKKSTDIFIHYHEYTSLKEYREGMILNRWIYSLEKKVFPIAKWISHTNSDRMRLFIEDNDPIKIQNPHILPNYPPKNWKPDYWKGDLSSPIMFIYVGALGLNTMYLQEFAEWIIKQKGEAIWDIYSGNITGDAMNYLTSLNTSYINYRGSVNYFLLPETLNKYDVGLILYKGHIPNYIYNAPNKLFEYWACGLDVWFPETMESSIHYKTEDSYPKIIPINFKDISNLNIASMINRNGLINKDPVFNCENEFDYLLGEIFSK